MWSQLLFWMITRNLHFYGESEVQLHCCYLSARSHLLDSKSVCTQRISHTHAHTHALINLQYPLTDMQLTHTHTHLHTQTHTHTCDVYFMLCWPSLCTLYLSQAWMKHSYSSPNLHIKQFTKAKFGFLFRSSAAAAAMLLLSSKALTVWHNIIEQHWFFWAHKVSFFLLKCKERLLLTIQKRQKLRQRWMLLGEKSETFRRSCCSHCKWNTWPCIYTSTLNQLFS